jgi:hypothetical protein
MITYEVTVDEYGTTRWLNEDGLFHRLDGPAIECANGDKWWYQNGERHRLDGPAVEYADGGKEWWVNDKLHLLDGPAVEGPDGTKEWWIEGKKYTKKEFIEKIDRPCKGNKITIGGMEYTLA